jgi:Cyclic nucleotide-binding domain
VAWTCDHRPGGGAGLAVLDAPAAQARDVLARADIFRGVETGALTALTGELRLVEFPCGHTVYAEGDPADHLYIIISGKVKIGRRSRGPCRHGCRRGRYLYRCAVSSPLPREAEPTPRRAGRACRLRTRDVDAR